jgi:hypothetical protein
MHADFFAKLLVVPGAEPGHRRVINAAILASRIIVVEHKVCWIFPVDSIAIAAFYHMYAIMGSVKKTVNITH